MDYQILETHYWFEIDKEPASTPDSSQEVPEETPEATIDPDFIEVSEGIKNEEISNSQQRTLNSAPSPTPTSSPTETNETESGGFTNGEYLQKIYISSFTTNILLSLTIVFTFICKLLGV